MGFPQVQIASNGVRIADDLAFAQKLKDAGLSTVYLHFDGVTPATNPFLKIHERAIENSREGPPRRRACPDDHSGERTITRSAISSALR